MEGRNTHLHPFYFCLQDKWRARACCARLYAAGRGTNVGIGLFLRTLIWLMSHIIYIQSMRKRAWINIYPKGTAYLMKKKNERKMEKWSLAHALANFPFSSSSYLYDDNSKSGWLLYFIFYNGQLTYKLFIKLTSWLLLPRLFHTTMGNEQMKWKICANDKIFQLHDCYYYCLVLRAPI